MNQVEAIKLVNLTDVAVGWHVVRLSAGPMGQVVALLVHDAASAGDMAGGAPHRDQSIRYRVATLRDGVFRPLDLPPTAERLHLVQPLPGGRWLVVGDRPTAGAAENARVYSDHGLLLNAFSVGTAIEDVQTTESGEAWIGYFDEGVFGGYPAADGLVSFGQDGRRLFRYHHQIRDAPPIADCYAFNVVSRREVWLWTYASFALFRLLDGAVDGMWADVPIKGVHAFAVSEHRLLSDGGYDAPDQLVLADLQTMQVEPVQPVTIDAAPLRPERSFARGPVFYFEADRALYALDLRSLPAS